MSEFVIERLGHLGDGIAEGPVYVPGALPGERVTGTLEGNVLRDVKIVEPSATRVKAPCRHYKSCGGCQLQHVDDAFLAEWKTGIVREALAAQGIETRMREIAVSPAKARRRAGFSARRTKKGATAGFHVAFEMKNLLPGSQNQLAVPHGNGQRRPQRRRLQVRMPVAVMPGAFVTVIPAGGDQSVQ